MRILLDVVLALVLFLLLATVLAEVAAPPGGWELIIYVAAAGFVITRRARVRRSGTAS